MVMSVVMPVVMPVVMLLVVPLMMQVVVPEAVTTDKEQQTCKNETALTRSAFAVRKHPAPPKAG